MQTVGSVSLFWSKSKEVRPTKPAMSPYVNNVSGVVQTADSVDRERRESIDKRHFEEFSSSVV